LDVELGEVLGGFDFVEYVGDEWYWPAVLDRLCVDVPVVLCWSSTSILLGYEEEGTGDRGLGWSDMSGFHVLVDELVQFFLFELRQWVDLAVEVVVVLGSWFEVNGVVPWSSVWELLDVCLSHEVCKLFVLFGELPRP